MEQQFIAWLRERLPPHPLLRLGPGDDAAVLRMAGVEECVVTVDLLTDQVDFVLAEVDPRRVGRKALAVNLSDLAAMAARPLAAVIAVALPRKGGRELAVQLYEGILPLAEKYDLAIAGGDTNSWDGPLVITATLLGPGHRPRAALPQRRRGRRSDRRHRGLRRQHPGQALRLRAAGQRGPAAERALRAARRHGRQRRAGDRSLATGPRKRRRRDRRDRSRADPRRCPPAGEQASDGRTPLEHALGDGEDFELLLAVPPDEARRMLAEQPLGVPLTDIGQFTAEPGLWQRTAGGPVRPLTPSGWEHTFT